MVYQSQQLVRASDFNALKDQINQYFGTGTGDSGYGGNSTGSYPVSLTDLPTVSIGDVITTKPSDPGEWLELKYAIESIAEHQGTSLIDPMPADLDLEVGDRIAAEQVGTDFTNFENFNSATNLSSFQTNKLTAAPANLTTTNSILTDTRTNPWIAMIQHEFKVVFGSTDEARWYFNTGGVVRLNHSHSGGSGSAQTLDWKNLINGLTAFEFNAGQYYALTSSWTTIFSQNGSGAYSANQFLIQAKYDDPVPGPNGARGSMIKIRSMFLDNYSGGGDGIDGTITATVDDIRSTGVFFRPQPTYCTTTNLEFFDQLVEFSTSFSANDVQRQNSGQQFVTTYTVTRTSGQGNVDLIYENKSNAGLQVWINGSIYSPGQTVTTVNLSAGNPSFSVTVTANAQNLITNLTRTITLRAVSQVQNTLDNIQFNTPASYHTDSRSASASGFRLNTPSLPGLWADVLNNYGTWDSNPADQFYNNSWNWTFPCNGTYRLTYACDNVILSGSMNHPSGSVGLGNPGFAPPGQSTDFQVGVSVGTPEVGGGSGTLSANCENVRVAENGPPPGFIPVTENPGGFGFQIDLID